MKDVPVPDYYWKVIEYKNGQECWLGPNEITTSSDYNVYHIDVLALKEKIREYYPNIKLKF